MRIVQLMTDQSRYFNPSKNYWFSFNTFLISLIGLYFRRLSFRVFMYFGIPRTHLQYVNINAAWNDSDHLI
jgi:hypothetical protein